MTAAGAPAPSRSGRATPRNAFTVDLEEWFHVCGVDALWRRSAGTRCRPESSRRRAGCSTLLDRAGVRATFFVVGWVAERYPRLVETIRDAGHEIGSHSYRHRRVYELDRDAFRRDLRASVAALARRRRRRGVAASARRNGRSTSARCGRSTCSSRKGFTLDASMAPLKMVGSVTFPRHPHLRATRGRTDPRGAAAGRRSIRPGDAARLGLGTADELAAPRAARDRAAESRGLSGRADRSSLGNRSRSAARAAAGRGSHSRTTSGSAVSASRLRSDSRPAASSVRIGRIGPAAHGVARDRAALRCQAHARWRWRVLALCGGRARRAAAAADRRIRPPPARDRHRRSRRCAALAVLDRAGALPFRGRRRGWTTLDAERRRRARRSAGGARGRDVPIWLAVPAPARTEDAEPWRAALRRLLERHGDGADDPRSH